MLFNDLYHPRAAVHPRLRAKAAKAICLEIEELRVRRANASALAAVTGCAAARDRALVEEMRLSFQIEMLRKRMKNIRFAPAIPAAGAAREELNPISLKGDAS